jgi:hypothetical protein
VSIELDLLLSEDAASAKDRAKNAFRDLAGDRAVVIVGTSNLAGRVAAEMAVVGRRALESIPLSQIADAIARHPDAVFVVCDTSIDETLINDARRSTSTMLINGSMSTSLSACCAAGAARVTSFALFAWSHPERLLPYGPIDLPHHVLEQKEDVRRAYDLLEDDRSRQRYVAEIRFRLHLDFASVSLIDVPPLPSGATSAPIVQQSDLWRVPLALGGRVRLCTHEGALVATPALDA